MPLSEADARDFLHRQMEALATQEWVQHVEHDPEIDRWYLRFGCEGRDAATIYFDLRQRSLYYELYFMPAPEGHSNEELWGWLLKRNRSMFTVHFALGKDGDVYLVGRTPLELLDETELDRIVGEIYEVTETWFQPAIRLGFRRG
jgi:hypothetical protein